LMMISVFGFLVPAAAVVVVYFVQRFVVWSEGGAGVEAVGVVGATRSWGFSASMVYRVDGVDVYGDSLLCLDAVFGV